MKKLSRRMVIVFLICMISGVLFVYIANSIKNGSIKQFDEAIINIVQGMESPSLTPVMKVFTWIGSRYIVIPITLIAVSILFFISKRRLQAFLFMIVIVGTISLNELLKPLFKRDRPEIHRIIDIGGFSFPSGHAMMAFSLYTIIAYVTWRNVTSRLGRVLLILFTVFMVCMIPLSRIYLGVHYPSDIVGGITASALWVTIAITGFSFYRDWHESKQGRNN